MLQKEATKNAAVNKIVTRLGLLQGTIGNPGFNFSLGKENKACAIPGKSFSSHVTGILVNKVGLVNRITVKLESTKKKCIHVLLILFWSIFLNRVYDIHQFYINVKYNLNTS